MHFFDRLFELFRARYPVLMLHTFEFGRTYDHLKRFCREDDYLLFQWNCADGLGEMGLNFDSVLPVGDRIYQPAQVLLEIERRLDSRDNELFVLEGMADFFHDPEVKVLLRKLAIDIPKGEGRKHVVMINPLPTLPAELQRFVSVLEVPPPGYAELSAILDNAIRMAEADVDEGLRHELVMAAEGLTAHEAALAYRLAAQRDGFGHRALESVREAFLLHAHSKTT